MSLQYAHRCRCLDPPVVSPVISTFSACVGGNLVETSGVLPSMPYVVFIRSFEIGMCFVDKLSVVLDTVADKLDTGVNVDDWITVGCDKTANLVITLVVLTAVFKLLKSFMSKKL